MADYATPLDLIDANQAAHEVTANANFDATSGAATFGRHASTTAALTWGYIGGRFNGTAIANGTLALPASTTNYIVVHKTTLAITVSTSNTNWNNTSTYGRCYKVTTGPAAVTNYEDHREAIDGTGIFSPNIGAGGGLLAANNLSDVASASTSRTNLGLVAIASSGSASDLSAGTVPAARMPALTGDVTTSAGAVATTIVANAVTNAKAAQMANNTYKGRRTAGTGDPEDVSLANLKTDLGLTGTNNGDQTITLTGDVTGSGTGSFATTIASSAVTNAKMANMAAHTFKGRNTNSTGAPEDVTISQAQTLLSIDSRIQHTYSYAATVTVDTSLYSPVDITLTGNLTLAASNGTDGQRTMIRLRQDGTGGYTLTLDSSIRNSVDNGTVTLNATASKLNYLLLIYNSTDSKFDLVSFNMGF